ncbi:hypothetical protein BJ742DRAFT_94360 [Cladochytrium replicatum]|nr:hypothetical protein BJ742DRAFT_94360 [Cladochytrium replicatum]
MSDTHPDGHRGGDKDGSQEAVVSSPSGERVIPGSTNGRSDPNHFSTVTTDTAGISPTLLSPGPTQSKLAHFFGTLAHRTSWTKPAKRNRDSPATETDEIPPPPASSETRPSNNAPIAVPSTRVDPSNPSRPPRLTSTPLFVEDLPSPLSLPPIANAHHHDSLQENSNYRNFGELDLPHASIDSRSHTSASYVTTEEPPIAPTEDENDSRRDLIDSDRYPTELSEASKSSDCASELRSDGASVSSASDVFLAQRRRELKGKGRALFEFYEEISEVDDSDRDDMTSGSNLSPEPPRGFRFDPVYHTTTAIASHTQTYVDKHGTRVTRVLTGAVYEARIRNAASQTMRNRDVIDLEDDMNSSIQATPEQMYAPATSFGGRRENGRESNTLPEETTSVIEPLPPSAVGNTDPNPAMPADKSVEVPASPDHDASASVPPEQTMSSNEPTAVNTQLAVSEMLPVNQRNPLERPPAAINTATSDPPLDPEPKPSKVQNFLCIPLSIFRGRHILRPKSKPSPGLRVSVPVFNPPPPPSHPPPQATTPTAPQPQTRSSRRRYARNEPVPSFEEILPMNMTLKMSATPHALLKSEEARSVDFQTPADSTPRTSTSSSRRKSLFAVFMPKQIRRMQGLEDLKQRNYSENWIVRRLTRSSTILEESPNLSRRTSKATEASLSVPTVPVPDVPKRQKERAIQMIPVDEPEQHAETVSPDVQTSAHSVEEQRLLEVLPTETPVISTQSEEREPTIGTSSDPMMLRKQSSGRKRKQDDILSASKQKRTGRYLADAPVRPLWDSDDEKGWSLPETARVHLDRRKAPREKRWGRFFVPAPKEK